MKQLVELDPWCVVQTGFDVENNRIYESLFSLGNGHFGGRGNHEERYSGDSLQGNYLAGIYYPDPTRVGWWKNGYPDYFAKVLNAADWKRLEINVDGEEFDLATCQVSEYRRTLRMRDGVLERAVRATMPHGVTIEVDVHRFLSMHVNELGAFRYRLSTDAPAELAITSAVDGDVVNEDSNHAFGFWDPVEQRAEGTRTVVVSRTKETGFVARVAADVQISVDGVPTKAPPAPFTRPLFAAATTTVAVEPGQTVEVVKFGANVTSRTVEPAQLEHRCAEVLDGAMRDGFDQVLVDHAAVWERKWDTSDVVIEGDVAAQQGIRFNIFGLNSTFTGDDPDLNIGPKGFTGEKYGGVTYWDTEAFCLPFYLSTSEPQVAKNLLRYRHRQLDKAIANAEKLGFSAGAALYPMVTINGEECHNEWEITFEEIHRNGAIAFAVDNYIRYTGDAGYLLEGGLDVLIGIARFWAQRVSWSEPRMAYVLLGVTGPNEYENNVDNNWYTSTMAQWCLRYAGDAIDHARAIDPERTARVLAGARFDEAAERARWVAIAQDIHLPEDQELGIFLQQTNYLDKEQVTVADLDPADRPINKHWSWDRILRSPYIKQADVLQGMWVFEDRYDLGTLERNFDYYEPRTVHESSLSPSIHAVLAVRLGRFDKALEMMLRSARLDLDDYNADTEDGCHTTAMAGTWIAAVIGFGGLQVRDGALHLNPKLPPGWTRLSFEVVFRAARLQVSVSPGKIEVRNHSGVDASIFLAGGKLLVPAGRTQLVPTR